jgi:uncharacterized protein (DUF1778 family)
MAALPKRERIEARATSEVKALIEHAAAITGLSVSDFLIQSAQDRAEELIERRSRVRLSVERSMAFAESAAASTPRSSEAADLAADYWNWVNDVERA